MCGTGPVSDRSLSARRCDGYTACGDRFREGHLLILSGYGLDMCSGIHVMALRYMQTLVTVVENIAMVVSIELKYNMADEKKGKCFGLLLEPLAYVA